MVLAGGRGSRLGGREKGELRVGGERLIDTVVEAALEAGCRSAIVVGDIACEKATVLREDPPFGGPAAGLAAAMPLAESDWIMLLACDLPHARSLCRLLAGESARVGPREDGVITILDGHPQWLAGCYRCSALADALAETGGPDGTSMRQLTGNLDLRQVDDPHGWSRDIDTPADLERMTTEGETDE